ncbi:MAG: DUF3048 domain-containing protein [bacterium]
MNKFFQKIKEDKRWQMGLVIAIVLLITIIVFLYFRFSDTDNPFERLVSGDTYRKLDGVMVDKEKVNPPIVAVMIENLSTIRDTQAGLDTAPVVYEALAEGGITRFLVIFPDLDVADIAATRIGPVRSARPYYYEWSSEYDALYTHVGGSPEALAGISGLGIPDLNAMYSDSVYFWRDTALAAPHNLFINGQNLSFALRDKDMLDLQPDYQGWKYEDEASSDDRGSGENDVTIDFSSIGYVVKWDYDQNDNEYYRFNAGEKHIDFNTGQQITADNVIVQYVNATDTGDNGRLSMDVTGNGTAVMFRNGMTYEGTWEKDSREDRTLFYTEDGKEYTLNRGTTWVEIIPPDRDVEYSL